MKINTIPRILVVDDDADIAEMLQYNLQKEGYQTQIAQNGQQAVEMAAEFVPNLILMDIMMPILDGVEASRQIKELPGLTNTFIIFLTARIEEYSEIAAFEAGGNDYINKPIKPRALMSRIAAVLKRETNKGKAEDKITVSDLVIDRKSYTVTQKDTILILPRKEFELLHFLAQTPDRVFSREELLRNIWGENVYVLARTVDVHVRKIREKIGEGYIQTIKGVGYKFVLSE